MAAGRNRIHTFFAVKQPGVPDRILVWDTQEISLGRSSENDISIDHAEISRQHAHFVSTGKSYVVQNLNTSNGTLVNGQAITTHALESRDLIQIGDVEMTFYRSPKDPVSLGLKVEYASQLKQFPGPSMSADNAEATMLGLVDPIGEPDEDFQVRSAGDFAYDLHEMGDDLDKGAAPRNLDAELEELGLEDLDIATPAAPPAPARSPAPAPAPAAARPAQAPARPAPAAARPAARSANATLSLRLEVRGLEGELRRALQGLLGKTLALPALEIRITDDDRG